MTTAGASKRHVADGEGDGHAVGFVQVIDQEADADGDDVELVHVEAGSGFTTGFSSRGTVAWLHPGSARSGCVPEPWR